MYISVTCVFLCLLRSSSFRLSRRTISRKQIAIGLLDDDEKLSLRDDMPQKFQLKSLDEISVKSSSPIKGPGNSDDISVNDLQSKKLSATFGSLSINDLKGRMVEREPKIYSAISQWPESKKIDLNGINPLTPLTFSVVPAAMCFIGWKSSNYMSQHFAVGFLNSEIYPIQRIAIVARNIIVGIFTLATGFSGVVCVGLILLGFTVAIGVIKGELDPNKKADPAGV